MARPAGPAPTIDDVVLHRLARAVLGQDRFRGHRNVSRLLAARWLASKLAVDSTERSATARFNELRHRSVGPRRPRHRRLERPRRAVRARRWPRPAPASCSPARRVERLKSLRAEIEAEGGDAHVVAARRDRPRQHQGRRRPRRDRDGHDRHPGQQLGRRDDAEAGRRRRRRTSTTCSTSTRAAPSSSRRRSASA